MPPETANDLTALLGRHAPDADALVCDGRTVTFGELGERSRRLAGGIEALGIAAGDRVAVWLPNCVAWIELEFALARIGAIAVAINTRFRAAEVEDILARSGARALVLWPGFKEIDFVGILEQIDPARLGALETLVTLADAPEERWRVVAYESLAGDEAPDAASPDAPCNVFTSSGTTGAPKLVVHRQRGIAWHAQAVAEGFGYEADDCVVLGALPLCGVFGFNTVMGALAAGRPSVLMPVFDAAAAVDLIERHRVTHMNASDEMLRRLLAAAAGDPARIATLREAGFAAFGGDARTVVDAGDALGKSFYMCYGSSEVQALMAHQPASAPPERRALGGGLTVHRDIEVRVRETDAGQGELEIRGPNVMAGYLGDDEAERRAFTEDGFVRTGDVGYLDGEHGFVYLTRMGDALRLGGFLVSPREIEQHLEGLDGIAAAQVVAVEMDGAAKPVAFVVLDEGAELDERAVIRECRERLAGFKVPIRVLELEAFPTTQSANGEKVLRGELRKRAESAV